MLLFMGGRANAVQEHVSVVVGKNAPQLESFAAYELCGYLDKLFGIQVHPSDRPDPSATAVFLIGNPSSNSLIKDFPSVSDQGLVIQRTSASLPTLVVGGGSPKAALWAIYELVERWGVRYLVMRDAFPPRSKFNMPELNVVMEPIFRVRAHPTIQDFADSGESWGIDEFRTLINQLTKMKFNRINIYVFDWQPYLQYNIGGIQRKTATLWYGLHYPITPDMPGRSVFPADAKEFWNPDLPVEENSEALLRAGVRLERALIDYGHQRGMECVINADISEYPAEFAPLLPGAELGIHLRKKLAIAPGPTTGLNDPGLHRLSSGVIRATIDTYPEADRLAVSINEWRQWTKGYAEAWKALDAKYHVGQITTLSHVLDASQHRGGYGWGPEYSKAEVLQKAADEVKGDLSSLYFFDWLVKDSDAVSKSKRPDMKFLYWGFAEELFPILGGVLPPGSELGVMPDNFPDHLLERSEILHRLGTGSFRPIIDLTIDDDNIGIVPQLTTSALPRLLDILRQTGWNGFVARERFPGDHDAELAYLARAAWDKNTDPDKIASEQLQAACGKACGQDLLITMHTIDDATHVFERNDELFSLPVPGMLMRHWKTGPVPAYLEENRKNYERGWESARKAATKATTQEGRSYAQFWVKRMEFATKYVAAVETVHRAAASEGANMIKDAAEQATDALSTLRDAIEAYASVARNQTDRGAIAVLVEHGYRPLQKKISQLQQSAGPAPVPAGIQGHLR